MESVDIPNSAGWIALQTAKLNILGKFHLCVKNAFSLDSIHLLANLWLLLQILILGKNRPVL